MNRKLIFDDFSSRLDKICEEGNPTKAQIYDALHKALDNFEKNMPSPPQPPKSREKRGCGL